MDARKKTLAEKEALALVREVDDIYATKGQKVIYVDLRNDKPEDRVQLLALLLGPTGNLRAPTFRKGRTLVVGFDAATYEKVLR